MSADAYETDMQKARESGMDGYLTKPIDSQRLFDTLWKYVRPQSQADQAENQGSNAADVSNRRCREEQTK